MYVHTHIYSGETSFRVPNSMWLKAIQHLLIEHWGGLLYIYIYIYIYIAKFTGGLWPALDPPLIHQFIHTHILRERKSIYIERERER